MVVKSNLIETVARALCQEDMEGDFHILTDSQYEALSFFMPQLEENGAMYKGEESQKHFIELNKLFVSEQRNKPKIFICNIQNDGVHDTKDEFWKDYKKYAEKAIEAYDKWLERKATKNYSPSRYPQTRTVGSRRKQT